MSRNRAVGRLSAIHSAFLFTNRRTLNVGNVLARVSIRIITRANHSKEVVQIAQFFLNVAREIANMKGLKRLVQSRRLSRAEEELKMPFDSEKVK